MDYEIKKAKFFAKLFDSQFEIFGIKYGLDPILNLIPFIGNFLGLVLSFYILKIGRAIGVSKLDFLKMISNIVLDFLIGAIPFVGVIFDVAIKANTENVKILEKYENKLKFKERIIDGEIIS